MKKKPTTTKEQNKTNNQNKQKNYIPKLRGTVCDSVSDARDGRVEGGYCCRRWGGAWMGIRRACVFVHARKGGGGHKDGLQGGRK